MLFKDNANHSGEIEIQVIRNGKAKMIWQEYRFLHYLRKHFGIKFPKLFALTGYMTRKACYANLLTTAGKGLISGRINGVGAPAAPTAMAIGTRKYNDVHKIFTNHEIYSRNKTCLK